jgi:hypothetical protein
MTLSATWTAFSFFGLTALAAGSFAFAGCTVTSGNPNDDGGTGNPTDPQADASTTTDSSTVTDAGPAVACEGSKQSSSIDLGGAQCQAKLNEVCCAELKGCFNLVFTADDTGASDDCNKYALCVDFARKQATPAEQEAAQKDCDLASPKSVQDAYDAITQCATDKANADCQ